MGTPVINKRPVNLDISTIKLPITATVSILHRVSGVALVFAVAVVLGLLGCSLRSPESFSQVQSLLAIVPMKLLLWAILAAFIYHLLAGVRHLIMDAGVGETLEGGKRGATIVVVLAVICILLAGVLIW
jgi:succinate dehydrogenase / fumarate reductase cytochrome b subunit